MAFATATQTTRTALGSATRRSLTSLRQALAARDTRYAERAHRRAAAREIAAYPATRSAAIVLPPSQYNRLS